VPELPDDCIVEIPGYFKDGDMLPMRTLHISNEVAGMLRPHAEQQRMTVDCRISDSYDLVLKAMQHEPMCAWIEDEEKIEDLTKLMLFHEAPWLPTEWKEWIPNETEIRKFESISVDKRTQPRWE